MGIFDSGDDIKSILMDIVKGGVSGAVGTVAYDNLVAKYVSQYLGTYLGNYADLGGTALMALVLEYIGNKWGGEYEQYLDMAGVVPFSVAIADLLSGYIPQSLINPVKQQVQQQPIVLHTARW